MELSFSLRDRMMLESLLSNLIKLDGRDVLSYLMTNLISPEIDELVGRDGRVVIADICGQDNRNAFIRFRKFKDRNSNSDLQWYFPGVSSGYHPFSNNN